MNICLLMIYLLIPIMHILRDSAIIHSDGTSTMLNYGGIIMIELCFRTYRTSSTPSYRSVSPRSMVNLVILLTLLLLRMSRVLVLKRTLNIIWLRVAKILWRVPSGITLINFLFKFTRKHIIDGTVLSIRLLVLLSLLKLSMIISLMLRSSSASGVIIHI
jgi:hypothetical protein